MPVLLNEKSKKYIQIHQFLYRTSVCCFLAEEGSCTIEMVDLSGGNTPFHSTPLEFDITI